MENLTGFQRDLLYIILNDGKPSGQDIRRMMEEYYEDNINHGRLYPNLDSIVEKGLVEKGSKDQRTNYYEITSKGKETIQERHSWENKMVDEHALVESVPA